METQKFSLWKKRHTLPTISKKAAITLLLLIIAAAILLPGGVFGVFYLTVAGALLAMLLTADRSLLWLLSVPGVGSMAYLTHALFAAEGTSALWSLAAFLFIPVGMALAACIYNRQSLTATVVVLSVVFGVILFSLAALQLQMQYSDIREGFTALRDQFQDGLTSVLTSIGVPGENGIMYVYTEKEVQSIVQSMILLLPAMAALTCELFAYLTAKIYRLLALSFGADFLFAGDKWPLTASIPAYIILVVSYFFTVFSSEASVISYAAVNLLYIFRPVTSAGGFHELFFAGKSRSGKRRTRSRIPLIVLCAGLFMLSPISLFILLSFWGAIRTLGAALRSWLMKRGSSDS